MYPFLRKLVKARFFLRYLYLGAIMLSTLLFTRLPVLIHCHEYGQGYIVW